MKNYLKKVLRVLIMMSLVFSISALTFATSSEIVTQTISNENIDNIEETLKKEDSGVKEEYNLSTAVVMMNYLTINTQDVYKNKDRYKINEIYDFLLNDGLLYGEMNTTTKNYIIELANKIFDFRLLDIKRNRVDFLHEQITSNMISAALKPDPLLSIGTAVATNFGNPVAIGISVGATVLNSAANAYNAYNETEQEYIKNNWELEDKELETVHGVRTDLFNYKADIVRDYQIKDEEQVLDNKQVEEYVTWMNDNNNNIGRIQHFEANVDAYKGYPMFWLVLAKSYYINKDYQKCIDAINKYYELTKKTKIFRYDRDFANTIQYGISSARNIMNDNDYVSYVNKFIPIIEKELTNYAVDWEMNFKIALYYIDLYNKTNDKTYLDKAYRKAYNNVNELARKQREDNKKYLKDYEKISIKKDASEKEKKEIEEYNKHIEEVYKKELPPVSGPLIANLDILLDLSEKLEVANSEKEKLNQMLHPSGETLFVCQALEKKYYFNDGKEHIIKNYKNMSDDIVEDCWFVELSENGALIKIPIQNVLDESLVGLSFKDTNNNEHLYTMIKVDVDRKTGYVRYYYNIQNDIDSLPDNEIDFKIDVDVKGDGMLGKTTKNIKAVKMIQGYESNAGGKCDFRDKTIEEVYNELLSYGYKEEDIEIRDFNRTKIFGFIPNIFANNKEKKVQDVVFTTNGEYKSGNAKLEPVKRFGRDDLGYIKPGENGYWNWGRGDYISLNNHIVILFWN